MTRGLLTTRGCISHLTAALSSTAHQSMQLYKTRQPLQMKNGRTSHAP